MLHDHDHQVVHDAARARRFDPTGTADIRARFAGEMARRWRQLQALAIAAITGPDDLLGLSRHMTVQSVGRGGDDPVRGFQAWLDSAIARVVTGTDGGWTVHYLDEAAARARSRAYRLVQPGQGYQLTDMHGIVSATAAIELQGIAEAVSQRAVRAVALGLLTKNKARVIAMAVAREIETVGKVRGRALVELTVSSAFNNASLDAFKSLGLTRVGIDPEHVPSSVAKMARARVGKDAKNPIGSGFFGKTFEPPTPGKLFNIFKREAKIGETETVEVLTAGDDDVCPECLDISDSGPYGIDEARGLIPAHPNCRCAFVPYFDERFAEEQAAAS